MLIARWRCTSDASVDEVVASPDASATRNENAMAVDEDASHWRYLAEGARNVVVRHASGDSVLRLAKVRTKNSRTVLHSGEAFLGRLLAHLGGSARYAVVGAPVRVSPQFCTQLDARIRPLRPVSRVAKALDVTAGTALQLPNMAAGNVLCVELKPKWCFLPESSDDAVKLRHCRFCMHQRLKLALGEIARLSAYCPLALSSTDAASALCAVFGADLCGADATASARFLVDIVSETLLESAVLRDIRNVQRLGADVGVVIARRDDAEQLDRFMTSCVLKDCSVLLTFARRDTASTDGAPVRADERLTRRVAIVDLDQKGVEELDRYYKLDRDIVANFVAQSGGGQQQQQFCSVINCE